MDTSARVSADGTPRAWTFEYIERATACHAGLVEALEAVLQLTSHLHSSGDLIHGCKGCAAVDRARRALSAARTTHGG